ncbi:MAG: hypothetical protein JXA30_02405 [Deltaproteobacteria bacterium]|nr:hypothetical protein [Deltaproteobacteria bacterium]
MEILVFRLGMDPGQGNQHRLGRATAPDTGVYFKNTFGISFTRNGFKQDVVRRRLGGPRDGSIQRAQKSRAALAPKTVKRKRRALVLPAACGRVRRVAQIARVVLEMGSKRHGSVLQRYFG